jgi:uncharacterized glyoxalase superfamily protein PhnB
LARKVAKKNKSKRKIELVPREFHTITPYLAVNGAAQAIDWYKNAFGAREMEREREQMSDGKIVHARLKIGDSIVMLSDIFPGSGVKNPLETGRSPITLHLYSRNVDKLWKRAVEAGAKVEMQLDDMFWGERYGQLTDPFGHSWSLSMRIQMKPEEMERKRQEAMKMFEQGQHA